MCSTLFYILVFFPAEGIYSHPAPATLLPPTSLDQRNSTLLTERNDSTSRYHYGRLQA